jgi:hypothetical protein
MYPILKRRNAQKIITSIQLLKSDAYKKMVTFEDEVEKNPIHSFFVTNKEFKDNVDNFCVVTEKDVRIYDEDMKLRITVNGLKIRGCLDVHQDYLYSIDDNISKPFSVKDEDKDSLMPQSDWSFS